MLNHGDVAVGLLGLSCLGLNANHLQLDSETGILEYAWQVEVGVKGKRSWKKFHQGDRVERRWSVQKYVESASNFQTMTTNSKKRLGTGISVKFKG